MTKHSWHKRPLEETLECVAGASGDPDGCQGCGIVVLLADVGEIMDMPGYHGGLAEAADRWAVEETRGPRRVPREVIDQQQALQRVVAGLMARLDACPGVTEEETWSTWRMILSEELCHGRWLSPLPPWLDAAMASLEANDA